MKRIVLLIALLGIIVLPTLANDSTYLNFTAVNGPATIRLDSVGTPYSINLQYSTDSVNWNTYTIGNTVNLADGAKVYFKALNTNSAFSRDFYNYYIFDMTGTVAADGNIMSLLDATMVQNNVYDSCFVYLFYYCSSLISAPSLPATSLADFCYSNMFLYCTSLTQAPSLPATSLADYCYNSMFQKCTNLTQAPVLPATSLASHCYRCMFESCSSLTHAPDLPATSLVDYCYGEMFYGCTSLILAPSLPATSLTDFCYFMMFYGCKSLIKAPDLPATSLADYCYNYMFTNCSSLIQVPNLPATSLTDGCYYRMFSGCSSLIVNLQAPGMEWIIPATSVTSGALDYMFSGTAGTMNNTPSANTTYYVTQYVDSASADVYFYCQQAYDTVPVVEYNLVMYKEGSLDTTNVYFSKDTSFVMQRIPSIIVIVDSVTGTTTTVTIIISRATYANKVDEINIHFDKLASSSAYSIFLTPLDSMGEELDNDSCSITTAIRTTSVDVVYQDTDDFFPTDQTDVYTLDGRYIGKYYLDLPPGIYLMRDKGRWHKFGKVR